jgi:ubiquinone/menaquinone biosynthesis C-methylase UbiE
MINGMSNIEEHYTQGNIREAILGGLEKLGKPIDSVTVRDLSAADEFHIGGRKASEHFFERLGFGKGQKILDIGAGAGGSARFAADHFEVHVTGIDLTPEYVETGRELNRWVGMDERVELQVGDATALAYSEESFDGAYSMHVFMNVPDKKAAFAEAFRVLRPGSVFGIYDVMRTGEGTILYPVPWAGSESTSFLATPEEYVLALEAAGFKIEAIEDRGEFAVGFFKMVREKLAAAGGPPPLGVHLLMGANAGEKVENLTVNLMNGVVAPFEIIARK